MKTKLTLLLVLSFALPLLSPAGTVPAHQVPRDAQWLIHLDVEEFRQSGIGSRLIKFLIDSRALEFGDVIPVNFATVVNGLDRISLYGPSLGTDGGRDPMADGVAVLRGSPELIAVLRGVVAAAELEQPDAVTVVEESPRRVLLFHGLVHLGIVSDNMFVISRSHQSLQTFFATLDGEFPNALGSNLLEPLQRESRGFFFAAVAEGINSIQGLPPQANVLKMTEGIALRVGERDSLLNLDVSLRTDLDETAVRVQQVLQGIVALASLAQFEHPELSRVLRSLRIASEGRAVRLDLSYPVDEAIKLFELIAGDANFNVTIDFDPSDTE